jgi:hypothetical protein
VIEAWFWSVAIGVKWTWTGSEAAGVAGAGGWAWYGGVSLNHRRSLASLQRKTVACVEGAESSPTVMTQASMGNVMMRLCLMDKGESKGRARSVQSVIPADTVGQEESRRS